jgi:O-antigen ligase
VALAPRSDASVAEAPVPRLQLWHAALLVWAAQPLLGIGPDNFRHTYGTVLGLERWDTRVHANNLYLELLADLGLLGSLAWWLIVAPAIRSVVGGLRAPPAGPAGVWLAGLGASLLAYLVHGALDAFLAFTAVATLFWLIVGCSIAIDRGRAWLAPRA